MRIAVLGAVAAVTLGAAAYAPLEATITAPPKQSQATCSYGGTDVAGDPCQKLLGLLQPEPASAAMNSGHTLPPVFDAAAQATPAELIPPHPDAPTIAAAADVPEAAVPVAAVPAADVPMAGVPGVGVPGVSGVGGLGAAGVPALPVAGMRGLGLPIAAIVGAERIAAYPITLPVTLGTLVGTRAIATGASVASTGVGTTANLGLMLVRYGIIKLPNIGLPSLPSGTGLGQLSLPAASLPSLPAASVPKLGVPSLPGPSLPKLHAPRICGPRIIPLVPKPCI